MKITFLMLDCANYRGGPIVNMRRLIPELIKRGHEIRILARALDSSPNIDHLEKQYGISATYLPIDVVFTPDRIHWILKELRKHPPDLFVPDCFVYGFFASRWVREAGIPTVGYFRCDDAFYWDVCEEFICGGRKWALSGVACVAQHLRNELKSRNPESTHLTFLPSGVPIPNKSTNQNLPGFNVCYIGRLQDEQKCFRETAYALFRNLETQTCSRIGFFGNGGLKNWLEEQITSRGLGNRVTVHGAVAPESLHSALGSYHASVLLSDYEGTPGAIMDAMAAGLVPVTTRIGGGTAELVEDEVTGLVCDDREDSFDHCLQRLAKSPDLRQQLAKSARKRIITDYSLEKTATRFENFAARILSAAGRKKAIRIPRRINLPPVRDALAREDRRDTTPIPVGHHLKIWIKPYIPRWIKALLTSRPSTVKNTDSSHP